MTAIPRQDALLLLGLVFLAGVVITLVRLFRSRKHGISIRMQVFLVLAVTTCLLTGTFALVVTDRFKARTVLFAHRAALDDAHIVAELVVRFLKPLHLNVNDGARLLIDSNMFADFTQNSIDTRVQLFDITGHLVFDTLSLSMPDNPLFSRPEVVAALNGKVDRVARLIEKNRVAAAAPVIIDQKIAGGVRVTKSIVSMSDILNDTAPKVMLLSIILAGAAALAGIVIGRVLGKPIENLTSAAHKIASGQRQARLPDPKGREVRKLTKAFESMRNELEQKHVIKNLAEDLSHELKNPVASIKAMAEVLEDAVKHDPEQATHFIGRINESADKIEGVIKDLLALARFEARSMGLEKKRLYLPDIVCKVIETLGQKAVAAKVVVEFNPKHEVTGFGDAVWLQRALENLVSNAIYMSPQESRVDIQLQDERHLVTIQITDHGPGISPSIKDRLFERFVTTRGQEGGTGLGVSIARAVAEAHGGCVEIASTGPEGTTMVFTIRKFG